MVYAPRTTTGPVATSMPFTVQSDQSTESGYLASDFVFGNSAVAYTATGTVVSNVTLHHGMSKLILNVQDMVSSTATISNLQKVVLGSVRFPIYVDAYTDMTHTVNSVSDLATAVTTGGSTGTVTLLDTSKEETETPHQMAAIIPPQTINTTGINLTLTFHYEDGDVTYEGTLNGVFAAGYSYEYTVTVSQKGLTISNAHIVPWGTGEGDTKKIDN